MADQKFEKKVRERLSDYREEPDDDLWGPIIAETSLTSGRKMKRWYIAMAASLALLIAVAAAYLAIDFKESSSGAQSDGKTESVVSNNESETQLAEESEPVNRKYSNDQIEKEKQHIDNDEVIISRPGESSETPGDKKIHESIARQAQGPLLSESYILNPTKVNGLKHSWNYPYSIPHRNFHINQDVSAYEASIKQEVEKKSKPDRSESRVKFYLLGMPTFSYNRVKANNGDDLLVTAIEKIPAFSLDRFGFRVESGITYQMTPRLSGFAGLIYFNRKQTFEYTIRNVTDTETKYVNGDKAVIVPSAFEEESREYNNDLSNLGVQFGLLYQVASNKFIHTVGTGIETHYALNKSDLPEEFEKPSLYLFYNLFYRLEYPKESRLKALVQPTFNYSFGLSEKLNTPFYVKPYGFGLNFGVTYKF